MSSELTASKAKAALLVALDELTRAQIASECGVAERTLYTWLTESEFQAAVEQHHRRIVRELVGPALARLKRNIRHGKPAEANKAIEIALKAAGWLTASEASNDGDDDGPPKRFVVEDPGDA